MSTMVRERRSPVRGLKRFFRSPKGYFLLILALQTAIASLGEGVSRVFPNLAGAMLAAAAVDLAIATAVSALIGPSNEEPLPRPPRQRGGKLRPPVDGVTTGGSIIRQSNVTAPRSRKSRGVWLFPSGAILTGLIVALVLSPAEPLYAVVGTAALAIASKHVFRTRWSNIFNPAAFGLVLAVFLFGSGESWWGSLAELPVPFVLVLLGAGLLVANHINKLPLVLAFLSSYFALFTASAFLGDPSRVAEVFRAPDANAAVFFAFFMLDDPPTCPIHYVDQVMYGIIVAVVSYAAYLTIGGEYFLLAGVLAGNAWESLRRVDENTGSASAAA